MLKKKMFADKKEEPVKKAPIKKLKQMEVPSLANKFRVLAAIDKIIDSNEHLSDLLNGVKIFINNKVD